MSRVREITSLTNDTIKAIRALNMKKAREETGTFLAEGLKFIGEDGLGIVLARDLFEDLVGDDDDLAAVPHQVLGELQRDDLGSPEGVEEPLGQDETTPADQVHATPPSS